MSIGIVVIGRNEGERLLRCLRSLAPAHRPTVYVDSGSTDGSVERARALGVDVIALDGSRPFTAARGRNAGFEHWAARQPELRCVQVVDGDCELHPEWLARASEFLEAHPEVAVVAGRRRERHPEASVWNRLADVEWDTPVGEVDACGGDALIRVDAWRRAGGYDGELIAGEDPEFCWRVRRSGGRIARIDAEMTLHDAALERASQWWRRQLRSGHAFAATVWLHRSDPDPGRLRRIASLLCWGAAWPALCIGLAWPTRGASLLGFAAWGIPWLGAYRSVRSRWNARVAASWATACVIGKLAEARGALGFAFDVALGRRRAALIEYKGPAA